MPAIVLSALDQNRVTDLPGADTAHELGVRQQHGLARAAIMEREAIALPKGLGRLHVKNRSFKNSCIRSVV